MEKTKIESLLGFAVRAGKVIYGLDGIEAARVRYYAVLLCATASDNARKKVLATAGRRGVPVVLTEAIPLQEIVYRQNCKVLAVTDRQMAQAILRYIVPGYRIVKSEEK